MERGALGVTMNRPKLTILAQTQRYLVVAKPSGLLVHRTKMAAADNDAVIQRLRDQLGQRVWAVHRLDRATSGCLIMTTNKDWVNEAVEGLQHPSAEKRYIALVRGNMVGFESPTTVETPIKIKPGTFKEALTHVQKIAGSNEPRCSLALALPRTGRNHQVRRHLRDVYHPVIRDAVHGDSKCNVAWTANWGLNRLALHCLSIDIPLASGERLQATCPVPKDLANVLHQMPWWEEAATRLPELRLAPPENE